MRVRWWTSLAGIVSVAVVAAIACGPAQAPDTGGQTTSEGGGTTGGPTTTTAPSSGSSGGQTSGAGASGTASVSGIPLDPNAKFGGTLFVSSTEEGPSTSNWEEAAGIASSAVHPQMNSLIQHQTWGTVEDYKNGAYERLHPDLAVSWEQSPDGLQWIFKLREGIKWSDGEPFTCADTKWSFDTIRTGEGLRRSPRKIHLNAIDNIQCPDDLTMVINMKQPKASLPNMLAMPYNVIFPEHIYAQNTQKLQEDPYKVGTGPFTLLEWVPGEIYRYERKDDYWDQPFPYLDAIELRIVPAASVIAAIRAGRVDFTAQYTGANAETLQRECTVCQFWPTHVHSGFTPLLVNHNRPPFNDPKVMEAISLAIDRTKVSLVAQQGWAEPARGGLYPSTSPWALPYERTKQVPGYDFENIPAQQQRAKEILASLGYQPGELVIPLSHWNNTGTNANVIPIMEDLQAAGFGVERIALETARAYDAMTAADFAVHLHGFFVSDTEADAMLYEYFYTGSDRNYARYSKPETDRLIDQQSTTTDPAERLRRIHDLQEIIMRDQPQYMIQFATYLPVWNKRVQGIMPGNNASWTYGSVRRHAHTWISE
jgi:peptide/nickel transport system substrate-binding protein